MLGNLLAPEHLIPVLLIILVMFGGKKIPELASGLGRGVREFKNGIAGAGEPATPTTTAAPAPAVAASVAAEPIAVRPGETVTVSAPAPEPKRLIS